MLARVMLFLQFEQAEANIWGSQLALLAHLNTNRAGDTLDNLRRFFYEPAAAQFPDWYQGYTFEGYLSFLLRHQLLSIDGNIARISQQGIEYLAWRAEQGRPPRPRG